MSWLFLQRIKKRQQAQQEERLQEKKQNSQLNVNEINEKGSANEPIDQPEQVKDGEFSNDTTQNKPLEDTEKRPDKEPVQQPEQVTDMEITNDNNRNKPVEDAEKAPLIDKPLKEGTVKPVLDQEVKELENAEKMDVKLDEHPRVKPVEQSEIKEDVLPPTTTPSYLQDYPQEKTKINDDKKAKPESFEQTVLEDDKSDDKISPIPKPITAAEETSHIETTEPPKIPHQPQEVKTIDTIEVNKKENDRIEKPEIIQIAIIEAIDRLLQNDNADLRDIKYQLEVLNREQEDEVLVDKLEEIQKKIEELIQRFNEIKRKYEKSYNQITISDLENIENLGISITDYLINCNGSINGAITEIKEIKDIEDFIDIINNIAVIDKEKGDIKDNISNKIEDYGMRDEEFIKLQDQYADIEGINELVSKYNIEIAEYIKDIKTKLDNNVDITKTIERTTKIVPDLNKFIQATILMTYAPMIPPTPLGFIFKATMYASAVNLLAHTLTPETEEKEITHTTITDYAADIVNGTNDIKTAIRSIDTAFDEINYIKNDFDKYFAEFQGKIPEYDELIKNILAIEKELTREHAIAMEYSDKMNKALEENNNKIKILEND